MNTTATITETFESVPQRWDDERDNSFFRIVNRECTPAFALGASVLLASYDADLAV
jgi:hypothetical protein